MWVNGLHGTWTLKANIVSPIPLVRHLKQKVSFQGLEIELIPMLVKIYPRYNDKQPVFVGKLTADIAFAVFNAEMNMLKTCLRNELPHALNKKKNQI